LLDPNFDPAGCLVVEVEERVCGFLLSLTRKIPFYDEELAPEGAWITAFGVHPAWQQRGLGSTLLTTALERLRQEGRQTIEVGTYIPGSFTPGVDPVAYAPGAALLARHGFVVLWHSLSMRAELTAFRIPEPIAATASQLHAQGITVRPVTSADIVPVLTFARQHFSWGAYREANEVLTPLFTGDPRQFGMVVALQGDTILGFAQHRAEHFGPIGVRADMRNRGIGQVVLAVTLSEMLKKGYHVAWFLDTNDEAARLYARCGFREVRRFAVLEKHLSL
jgi:ribosomal protein S18 acetylase RimI-like enzyme